MINRYQTLWLGGGPKVSIPVSQYDTMWRFIFTIINGSVEWTIPTGATAVLNGRKPDGNVIAISGTIADNKVTVDATEQMTVVAGEVVCELTIMSGGKVIGTANFILAVEDAPKRDGEPISESDLSAYAEMIAAAGELVEEAQEIIEQGPFLPPGGTPGQVLTKTATGEEWGDVSGLPDGGSNGQVLTKTSDGAAWSDAGTPTQAQTNTALADYLDEHPEAVTNIPNTIKSALLACFAKVAWVDAHGQDYYDALYNALMTRTPLSIAAVFTQGSAVIYDTDSLDTLRQYLVVTASYDDGTTGIVTDYTLSGTLTAGTSTIMVDYYGKTDTFTVTVTHIKTLDDIAYGTLTYRDIFVTNNFASWFGNIGDSFVIQSADTYKDNNQTEGYKIAGNSATAPTLSTTVFNSAGRSIKYQTSGQTQYMAAYNVMKTADWGKDYIIGCACNMPRYASGKLELQMYGGGSSSVVRAILAEETDGWVPVITIGTATKGSSNFLNYNFGAMGNTQYGDPDLTAYLDDIVITPKPDGMTLEQARTLFGEYLEMIKSDNPANYVDVGGPTIVDNILTVENGKYVRSTYALSPSAGDSWKIRMKYKYNTLSRGFVNIFGGSGTDAFAKTFIVQEADNHQYTFYVSADKTNWTVSNRHTGTITFDTNTWYYLEFGYTGTKYYLVVKTGGWDGTMVSNGSAELTSTTVIYNGEYVGFGVTSSVSGFDGQIDLTECSISFNGEVVWAAVS